MKDIVRHSASSAAMLVAALACTGCPQPATGDDPSPSDGLTPASWTVALQSDTDVGAFLSVWGSAPDDVWAVGGQVSSVMDPGTGAAYRRVDGDWAPADVPAGTPLLNWVHGTRSRVWVVGNAGAALYRDADSWVDTDTPTEVPLWGCWVVADDDVWAVGGDTFDDEAEPVLIHWDGTSWTNHPMPTLDGRNPAAMFKVWAAATDDVWAVGDVGVIVHYDGQSWSQVLSGTGNDLISLWGIGPDEVVAVGGRSIGTIARWDGSTWTTEEVGRFAGLNGIWMDPSGDAALAGNIGGAGIVFASGFETELEDSGAGVQVLHGIYGFDNGERIAVGGSLDRSPPYVGIIVETE
ncbi:MAG: hypothetical protein K0V04_14045 [Deltaproteobacteria bacterium]|nr:hypothetical protein [Deltaproteobacteria bacterium]